MKIKFLFLIFAFLLSGIVYAQDRPNRQGQGRRMSVEERVKAQADRLKKELNLTNIQYDSVKAIQLRQSKKTESLRNKSGENTDMGVVYQKNQEELNKEYKKLFTDEQYKKYEEMIKNRRNRGGENGNRRQRNN